MRRLTTATASIIFTIPSLALFVVLPLIIPTRILDEANVIVALTLYTVALLVRVVPEALDAVPAAVLDAATAVGYKPIVRVLKVELPLAIPVLVAGLRVVAVTNISMVSVGSVIGIGGLGTWFTEGYQADKSDQIIAGIIAIFVLAIVVDTLIMLAGKVATPWTRVGRVGRRGGRAESGERSDGGYGKGERSDGGYGQGQRSDAEGRPRSELPATGAVLHLHRRQLGRPRRPDGTHPRAPAVHRRRGDLLGPGRRPIGMIIGHTGRGTFLVVTESMRCAPCPPSVCCCSACCCGGWAWCRRPWP